MMQYKNKENQQQLENRLFSAQTVQAREPFMPLESTKNMKIGYNDTFTPRGLKPTEKQYHTPDYKPALSKNGSLGQAPLSNKLNLFIDLQSIEGGMLRPQTNAADKPVFIPVFPHLYSNLQSGRLIKNGDWKSKNVYLTNSGKGGAKKVHCQEDYTKVQFKFDIMEDPLLHLEESRKCKLEEQQLLKEQVNHLLKQSQMYMVDIEFGNIKKMHVSYTSSGTKYPNEIQLQIAFQLTRPATVLRKKLFRENDEYGSVQLKNRLQHVRSVFNMNDDIFLNYWNNNQVFVFKGIANKKYFDIFMDTIQINRPKLQIYYENNGTNFGMVNPSDEQARSELNHLQRRSQEFLKLFNQLLLPLRYAILSLLSQNKVTPFSTKLNEMLHQLVKLGWNKSQVHADYAAYLIDLMHESGKMQPISQPKQELLKLFNEYATENDNRQDFDQIQKRINTLRQRRVFVTPTLLVFAVTQEDESNRVIREYRNILPNFLRLSFTMEDFSQGYYFGSAENGMLGYIHNILTNGINVGNKQFSFIGYSNSQLKGHSCWYYCKDEKHPDPKVLIDNMGEFNTEKNILKRQARKGQCFSTSKFVCELEESQVSQVKDIKRNQFNFTDGVGYISPQLAEQIAQSHKFTSSSAFQIRLGGAKGVLMLDPELEGTQVQLRDSQVKFQSDSRALNVIRCSTFSQGFLNRQMINLMHCLGVPEEFFFKVQSKAKETCTIDYIQNDLRKEAKKLFRSKRHQQITLDIKQQQENMIIKSKLSFNKTGMSKSLQAGLLGGMKLMKEPLISSILFGKQLVNYQKIKRKSRILLPDSSTLIGTVDTKGILKEGEVFIQIRRDSFRCSTKNFDYAKYLQCVDQQTQTLTGNVIVSRNPCTHPGDIRVLTAVDKPELRDLTNIVVFSSEGKRPECNKMAGGDLDGDVYFVSWDKELLEYLPKENVEDPQKYEKPDIVKDKPDAEELPDYFCFYLERDILGKLSNLHLALCDQYGQYGAKHEQCIRLSELCSVAVDFAKHGECVSKHEYKEIQDSLNAWPDFFEKKDQPVRVSNNILGKLYRDVNDDEAMEQWLLNEHKFSIELNYDLDKKILSSVDQIQMHKYLCLMFKQIVQPMIENMKSLMSFMLFANESQLFTSDLRYKMCDGSVKNQYHGQCHMTHEEAMNQFEVKFNIIKDKFTTRFENLVKENSSDDQQALKNMSVALYLATYFDCNISSKLYHKQFDECSKDFHEFYMIWSKQEAAEAHLAKQIKNKQYFMEACQEAENGDQDKFQELLKSKKLFSMPWLICPSQLMAPYAKKIQAIE